MNKLIICEKNNAAQRIAQILSDGKAKRSFINRVAVYDFEIGDESYTVIGLRGHILSLDYPQQYNHWYSISPKKLIWVKPYKKIEAKNIVNVLKKLAIECDEVIIATDYDREGELIGVEGLEIIKRFNKSFTVKRAKFSALTKSEIINAFNNLTDVDYNLSKSAESRQIIDLTWGATLTRFISLASSRLGKDFLSVGRVQSPTLALIVDKEKEIKNFKPKPYWEIIAELEKKSKFSALHINGRFWEEEIAEEVFNRAKTADFGKIINIEKEERKESPPSPFNTTSFLRSATPLGFTAVKVMRIAEDLYTKGLISYPRTDNTVYPKSIDFKSILKTLSSSFKEAEEILKQKDIVPTKGKKFATDHPPIHPVESCKKDDLTNDQWKIYELVVRRFFATLAPSSYGEAIKVSIDINSETFIAKGYKILDLGWRKYYPYIKFQEIILPELLKGEEVRIIEILKMEKKTKPPNRYSQGSLILDMEKLNLGTKSTRHEIIQKLYDRRYIEGSPIVPTDVGIAVIDALENYAKTITRAEMTSKLEKEMDEIAEGKKDIDMVVKESQEILEQAFKELENNKTNLGRTIKEALVKQDTIGSCKFCGGTLVIVRSRFGKRFVGCSNFPSCKNTFPLPQKGVVIPTSEICKYCGSPKIKLITKGKKPWITCINMDCTSKK